MIIKEMEISMTEIISSWAKLSLEASLHRKKTRSWKSSLSRRFNGFFALPPSAPPPYSSGCDDGNCGEDDICFFSDWKISSLQDLLNRQQLLWTRSDHSMPYFSDDRWLFSYSICILIVCNRIKIVCASFRSAKKALKFCVLVFGLWFYGCWVMVYGFWFVVLVLLFQFFAFGLWFYFMVGNKETTKFFSEKF